MDKQGYRIKITFTNGKVSRPKIVDWRANIPNKELHVLFAEQRTWSSIRKTFKNVAHVDFNYDKKYMKIISESED